MILSKKSVIWFGLGDLCKVSGQCLAPYCILQQLKKSLYLNSDGNSKFQVHCLVEAKQLENEVSTLLITVSQ